MKYTLTLLTLLISSLCFSQTLVDVNKIYIRKDITVTDNLTYKWDVFSGNDTARYFNAGNDVYEATVVFRKKGVPVVTEKIDGELATFVGNWVRTSTNPGWYLNTIAFSNTVGSTASYTFTGTKIELWAERLATHGIGTITTDNGAAVPVNFNVAPFGLPVKIFEGATLPLGTHSIKLTVGSGYCLWDYVIVTK